MSFKSVLGVLTLLASLSSMGAVKGKYFDRAIFVIFENKNYSSVIQQPFFKSLADRGAHFTNFFAMTHPSQPNYIMLTSGARNRVYSDGGYDVDAKNVVDLLEAKGITWKAYVEGYPGNCFTGKTNGDYARKHNPFISYNNIRNSPKRCANIVNAEDFDVDTRKGALPEYVFYVPDNKNSGHDKPVEFSDKWYEQTFSKYINDPVFMDNTILISTYDESSILSLKNRIYTSIIGPNVQPGVYSQKVTLYSLLKLVEDNWNLGNLGREDVKAPSIPGIWKMITEKK